MTALLRKHPLASYFLLTFVLSWGGVWAVITPGEIPARPAGAQHLFPLVYMAMLAGPPIAGILMTAITSGSGGLRAYRGRLLRWRISLRWYAIALLTAPVVLLATAAALSLSSPEFRPAILNGRTAAIGPAGASSVASFALLGIGVGIGAGFFEELGWTGFAIPTMRAHHGVFRTGAVVGLLWGAWHFLAVFWGSAGAFGSVPIPVFMVVALFAFLPPYRVLMVRIYNRTESLLVAILMHASLTASVTLLSPSVSGAAAVVFDLAVGAAFWVLVALSAGWRSHRV